MPITRKHYALLFGVLYAKELGRIERRKISAKMPTFKREISISVLVDRFWKSAERSFFKTMYNLDFPTKEKLREWLC